MEKPVSLPSGVALRGTTYHLQIKVPLRMREQFPGPFWIRTSLGTGDKAVAAALAHKHWAQASEAFARADAALKPHEFARLTPALAQYVVKEAQRTPLAFDDVIRYEPGGLMWLLESMPPPVRFLTGPGNVAPPRPTPAYLEPSPDGAITPAQLERLQELQALSVGELARSVSMGRLDAARQSAEAACSALGVSVDWSLPEHRPVLVEVLRALLGAWIGAAERSAGKPIGTPVGLVAPEIPATEPETHRGAKTLAGAFAAWKTGKKPDAVKKTTRALALLNASKQDLPLQRLSRQNALAFRDFINAEMPNAVGKTRSDVLASVQALLNFAVTEKGWLESNPWAGTAIAKGRAKRRDPWVNEILEKLFSAPLFTQYALSGGVKGGRDAQYWLPILALLTGARQAELWQLRIEDVVQRDGVWLIDINEDTDEKSVKSAAGVREVAVHPKLLELGFVDYVNDMQEAGHVLVFPHGHVKPSRPASVNYSDFFREQCRTLGLYQRYRDFHAFRTTVGTALRAVDPSLGEALITAVMGHEASNVGAANYHRPAPKTLQRVVSHLDFPAASALKRVYKKHGPP